MSVSTELTAWNEAHARLHQYLETYCLSDGVLLERLTLRLLDEAEQIRPLPPVYQAFKSMALTRSGCRDEGAQLLQRVVQLTSSSTDNESKYALTYAQLLEALASENRWAELKRLQEELISGRPSGF